MAKSMNREPLTVHWTLTARVTRAAERKILEPKPVRMGTTRTRGCYMKLNRLSGTDALFLSAETPSWHQHVGGLAIVDPGGSNGFSFEAVRDTTKDRLPLVPKFRWKLKEVPLHLDRPVWVEDKEFDIRRHVRRIAVPPPGGRREVGELLGMLMSYQLDRRHPLWEMWYIDGVVGGQVALMTKFHHCLMDGVSGAGLAELLLDLEPDPAPRSAPDVRAEPVEPSDWELFAKALIPTLESPARFADYMVRSVLRGVTIVRRRIVNPMPFGTAGPCFNGSVGAHRTGSFASVALDDVRAVKDEFGVTVNDVVLALVAGALRTHMLDHGDMPEAPLVAGIPVSTRTEGDTPEGNRMAIMSVSLATHIEDPLERLRVIRQGALSSKQLTKAVRTIGIRSVGEVAPPFLVDMASRAAWAADIGRHAPVVQNVLVSNVPGPRIPLYICGCPVSGMYAASVLVANQGLNITVLSYTDRVDFGVTADADLVEDPWEISDGIPVALAELMDASGLGKPTQVYDPFDR
jgi:WS/DGAT/MGAT family acyltransferase